MKRIAKAIAIGLAWPIGIMLYWLFLTALDAMWMRTFGPVPLWAYTPHVILGTWLYVGYCWRAAKD